MQNAKCKIVVAGKILRGFFVCCREVCAEVSDNSDNCNGCGNKSRRVRPVWRTGDKASFKYKDYEKRRQSFYPVFF